MTSISFCNLYTFTCLRKSTVHQCVKAEICARGYNFYNTESCIFSTKVPTSLFYKLMLRTCQKISATLVKLLNLMTLHYFFTIEIICVISIVNFFLQARI